MNVLIVSEDPRLDKYALLPIIRAAMAAAGKPRAKVAIDESSRTKGVDHLLAPSNLARLIRIYPSVHLFLVVVDRDCDTGRRSTLDRLEHDAGRALKPGRKVICAEAWEELEVWILAGLDLPQGMTFSALRADCHPKERYFDPVVRQRRLELTPGRRRQPLAIEAVRRYRQMVSRCRPDLGTLETRIREFCASR